MMSNLTDVAFLSGSLPLSLSLPRRLSLSPCLCLSLFVCVRECCVHGFVNVCARLGGVISTAKGDMPSNGRFLLRPDDP